jgi:S-adenosylmethionine uptake transporter
LTDPVSAATHESHAALDHARMKPSPILLAVGGVGVLCAMDAVVKHLSLLYAVPMVLLLRYVCALPFVAGGWWLAGRPPVTREMLPFHAARAVVILMSALTFFWALTKLPLAEAIVITFIAPLMVPLFAAVLLKEPLRRDATVAGLLGFAGVLVAVQGAPAGADTPVRTLAVAACLFAAATYALSVVLMRFRAQRDGPELVTLLGTILPGLLVAPLALAVAPLPPLASAPTFLLAGALSAGGFYLLAAAYARAEAQLLAPTEFTALGWAALFGYVFFAEEPRWQVYAGAAIIVAACLRSARLQRVA